jgi:hypothetical protein
LHGRRCEHRPGRHGQVPATHNEQCRGQRPGATTKYLRRTTSGATGNGLSTTIKYLRGAAGTGLGTTPNSLCGAAGIGLGTTIKYLRRSTSGAAGIGQGTTNKYLRRTTGAAAGNGQGTTAKYLRGAAGIGLGNERRRGKETVWAPRPSTS